MGLRSRIAVLLAAAVLALALPTAAFAATPHQVTGLKVTAKQSTTVSLAWNAASHASRYYVYRSTNKRTWTLVGSTTGRSYKASKLASNKYYYFRVRARNSSGYGKYSSAIKTTLPPAKPGGVTAGGLPGGVRVKWNATSKATLYRVSVRNAAGTVVATYSVSATVAVCPILPPAEALPHTFAVQAYSSAGGWGDLSAYVAAASLVASPPAPAVEAEDGGLHATWNPAERDSSAASGRTYDVERSEDAGATWSRVATDLAEGDLLDTTVSEGTAYTYRVRAHENGAYSDFSDASAAVTVPPAGPAISAVTLDPADGSVTITYDSLNLEPTFLPLVALRTYDVERSDDGGTTWARLATDWTYGNYRDTTAEQGTVETYRVRVRTGLVESGWGTRGGIVPIPLPVASLSGTAAPDGSSVALSWQPSPGAWAYSVYRWDGGVWTPIVEGQPAAMGTACTDGNPPSGSTATYQVRPEAGSSLGLWTASAGIAVPAPPAVPTGLTAAWGEDAGGTYVSLAWTPTPGATGFVLSRYNAAGGSWADVATVGGNAATYEDRDPQLPGAVARYRVRATYPLTVSAPSPEATVAIAPRKPSGLAGQDVGQGQVLLTWTAPGTGIDYRIERSDDGSTWEEAGTIEGVPGSTADSWVDGGIPEGVTDPSYRVYAGAAGTFNPVPAGPVSVHVSPASEGGDPSQPAAPEAFGSAPTGIGLTWNPSDPGTTQWSVFYRKTGTTAWSRQSGASPGETWVTGLDPDTYYDFAVQGTNGLGVAGPLGAVAIARTEAPGVPGVPEGLLAEVGGGDTYINLSWELNGSDTYLLRYRKTGTGTWSTAPGVTGYNTFIGGLAVKTPYEFQIAARNRFGTGAWSTSVFCSTP